MLGAVSIVAVGSDLTVAQAIGRIRNWTRIVAGHSILRDLNPVLPRLP